MSRSFASYKWVYGRSSIFDSIQYGVQIPYCRYIIHPNSRGFLWINEEYYRFIVWRYRYRIYRTDQHCTGTDNYSYSNGQQFREYWLYWLISGYIYRTGEL